MRRGKQQILFNFLPEKTFDFEGGQFICKVTNVQASDDPERQLNKPYVLDRVAWLLQQWPEERRRGFPDIHQQDRYVLVTPRAVQAEIFPLLFECTNKGCRRAILYHNVGEVSQYNPELRCHHCKGRLIQLHHVLIHSCGHIRPFILPSCPRHKREHLWLNTGDSQKYAQFRWQCRLCSFQSPIIEGTCDDCNLPKKQMRPIVHRATASYYPQYRTLINLPGKDLDLILRDPERQWLAIAACLRIFDHGPDLRLRDLAGSAQGQAADQDALATLARHISTASPERRAIMQAHLDALQQEFAGAGRAHRRRVLAQARQLITLQGEDLEETGRELLEFVRIRESLHVVTIKDLEQKARQESSSRLPLYQEAYRQALLSTGLADVHLIGDFPVTTVLIGFTRDRREADETVIRAFPRLQSKDPRTPLYTETTETEALLFRLNLRRVMRWLRLNGLITEEPAADDEATLHAWILNRMKNVNPFREITRDQPVTQAIFGLVHSFSHLVLRQAVILSGFDRTSLSEYLFPRALSFVLYSNNRTAFTIGGLYTLFEQTLHEHLRAVMNAGEICIYDPVCLEEMGACHACMHISEMSCEYFNRNLHRKYLFGRLEPDGREYIGYWDQRCAVEQIAM
ncbi:hypothetical protein [Thermogemmatispora onikobensis]|uniref:hypothetical protein n=1 Tax=Thermogemmatispora onikobensis TaxID=732234 RepID=UPI000853AEC9|nr:hypothetical protein [Thermogemmatispora onikobensis]